MLMLVGRRFFQDGFVLCCRASTSLHCLYLFLIFTPVRLDNGLYDLALALRISLGFCATCTSSRSFDAVSCWDFAGQMAVKKTVLDGVAVEEVAVISIV